MFFGKFEKLSILETGFIEKNLVIKLKDKLSESKFRQFAFEITEPHINEYYENNPDLNHTLAVICGVHIR